MQCKLFKLYRECRDLCCSIVGETAKGALARARLVAVAEAADLEVTWELEQDPCLWEHGNVGDWISERAWFEGVRSGRYEVLYARVETECGRVLASLGGIIVDHRHPRAQRDYKRGFELELLAEAASGLMQGNA